ELRPACVWRVLPDRHFLAAFAHFAGRLGCALLRVCCLWPVCQALVAAPAGQARRVERSCYGGSGKRPHAPGIFRRRGDDEQVRTGVLQPDLSGASARCCLWTVRDLLQWLDRGYQ
ncbi:unnamed protein product, partial [Symbiodinium sp. KB8]